MGMVVYFPAVAPPEAYAGLITDKMGRSATAAVVVAVADDRKKCLRVVDGDWWISLSFIMFDADSCVETSDTLHSFVDTGNDDGGSDDKPWMPAAMAVNSRDRVRSFVMVMVRRTSVKVVVVVGSPKIADRSSTDVTIPFPSRNFDLRHKSKISSLPAINICYTDLTSQDNLPAIFWHQPNCQLPPSTSSTSTQPFRFHHGQWRN